MAPSFVRNAFGPQSKEQAHDILEAVILAFKGRLDELDWIKERPEIVDAIKEKVSQNFLEMRLQVCTVLFLAD